jgi:hypothetical protein
MTGAGLTASLAMVLRVTGRMFRALTSLAPEPTEMVTAAPPLDPVVPAPRMPGIPGMLFCWIMDIPLEPIMKNVVGTEGPPGALVT